MLFVALEMLLEMPEMRLFCSAGFVWAADFVPVDLGRLDFLSFLGKLKKIPMIFS